MSSAVMKPRSYALTSSRAAAGRCSSATCASRRPAPGSSWKLSGREPVRLRGDEALEVAPVQQRVAHRRRRGSTAASAALAAHGGRAERDARSAGEPTRARAAAPRRAMSGQRGEPVADAESRRARSPATSEHERQRDRRPHACARPRRAPSPMRRSVCDAVCHSSSCRRDDAAAARACARSRRPRPRLMRQEDDGERRTAAALVTASWPDRRVVGAPRLVAAAGGARRAAARRATARAIAPSPSSRPAQRRSPAGRSSPRSAARAARSRPVLRRRLSRIFQRESSESRLRLGPVGPGHPRCVSHRRSCQSPRIQRCLRRVDVR